MNHRRTTLALAALLALAFLALPATAFAGERLLGSLPGGHNGVIAVDFDKLKSSPFFERGLGFVEAHPQAGPYLRTLSNDFGIDVREDLSALAIATNTPPLSAAMLANPAGAIARGAETTSGTTILVRGSFDAPALLAQLGGDDLDGDSFVRGDAQFQALGSDTIAIAQGNESYRQRATSQIGSGPGSAFTAGLSKIGNGQGLYFLTAPDIDEETRAMGADAEFAGVGLHLGDSVRLTILLTLSEEERAEAMATEVQQIREQAASNPMVTMFGARPLLDNLSIRQNSADLLIATSLTNAQAENLLSQVLRLTQTNMQLQQPLGGDRLPEPGPSQEVPRDGADADFN